MATGREINKVIVHCAATMPSMDIGLEEIKRWHTAPEPEGNGWSDVGYHFIIRRNGQLEYGRPVDRVGMHAKGENQDSVGVCLVGGLNENREPDSNFTLQQLDMLRHLIKSLELCHGPIKVYGHRDLPGVKKACPCFDVTALLNAAPNGD